MRSLVGNYKRVETYKLFNRKEMSPKDRTVASQYEKMTGDWLVWYAKGGTVRFMPSEYKTLGQAKKVARRLRVEGYEVWFRKGAKV